MIESKDALVENFMRLAAQFEASQNPVTGIDLDDAAVKLKRYVLSQDQSEELGRQLHDFTRLVRSRDMDSYVALLAQIREAL